MITNKFIRFPNMSRQKLAKDLKSYQATVLKQQERLNNCPLLAKAPYIMRQKNAAKYKRILKSIDIILKDIS